MISVMNSEDSFEKIQVSLIEDDPHFQAKLSSVITGSEDMNLVSVCDTRAQGLSMLSEKAVDVLLVDLGLPDGSGIDVIREAHHQWPNCRIMVCTVFGDEEHVMRSLYAGATGYLLKDSSPLSMLSEIRSLYEGGSPISPLIARKILTQFVKQSKPAAPNAPLVLPESFVALSTREEQVLELITKGFTAEEIGKLMEISKHTVLTYVRRIYKKLNVTSKAEAIYEARQYGLLND